MNNDAIKTNCDKNNYASPRDILNLRAKRAYNYAIANLGKSRLGAIVFASNVLRTYNYVPAVISNAILAL
jgi:hypothetical protein